MILPEVTIHVTASVVRRGGETYVSYPITTVAPHPYADRCVVCGSPSPDRYVCGVHA